MPKCERDGVVIRARLTAISAGTELRVYRAIPVDKAGQFLHETIPFVFPAENGYSMVADVVEVGAEVSHLSVGDRVFAPAPHKEFAAVPVSRVVSLPDEIPDEEAVLIDILEVAHIAIRQGYPPAGGNVAIVGQGIIGLSITAYASAFGFRTVVVDRDPGRLEIARQMGALVTVSPDEDDAIERVVRLFEEDGADVTFEAASNWAGIRTAMEMTRTDGKVVIVSRHTNDPDYNPVGHPFLGKRLHLITSYGYPPEGSRWSEPRSMALTVDLLARRRLNLTPMLTHRFTWDQLPEVYRQLDEGDQSIVGALFDWTAAGD